MYRFFLITFFWVILTGMSDKEIKIYSEVYGDKTNPAIILNSGAGCQMIVWDDEFCKKLASRGYFVIRYDYRNTGLSSDPDYETNPYNVLDLTDDAIKILSDYNITKAHFAGYSMGGQLAQLAAAYRPDSVSSIILFGTSTDFRPGFDGFEGIYKDEGLSGPVKEYVDFMNNAPDDSNHTIEQKADRYVEFQRWLDGRTPKFEEDFFKKQGLEHFSRTNLHDGYAKHAPAMKASFELHENSHAKINVPTLIIHGKLDPVFPEDHGYDLQKRIANSELALEDDLAHTISPRHFDRMVDLIDQFIKKTGA